MIKKESREEKKSRVQELIEKHKSVQFKEEEVPQVPTQNTNEIRDSLVKKVKKSSIFKRESYTPILDEDEQLTQEISHKQCTKQGKQLQPEDSGKKKRGRPKKNEESIKSNKKEEGAKSKKKEEGAKIKKKDEGAKIKTNLVTRQENKDRQLLQKLWKTKEQQIGLEDYLNVEEDNFKIHNCPINKEKSHSQDKGSIERPSPKVFKDISAIMGLPSQKMTPAPVDPESRQFLEEVKWAFGKWEEELNNAETYSSSTSPAQETSNVLRLNASGVQEQEAPRVTVVESSPSRMILQESFNENEMLFECMR